jgi:hypothetical protein
MWIRSQNKNKLINVNYVGLYNDIGDNVPCQMYGDNTYIGEYINPKRCIEILDDIQEKMFNCDNNYTYDMPKE